MSSPASSRLTALLHDRKDLIVQLWMSRIRNDPKIPQADTLSDEDLVDYTPKLLDELVASLLQSVQPGTPGGATGLEIGHSETAKAHVRHRIAQRYTLAEELRELSALRAVIVDLCAQEGVALGGEESQLVHSAIDEVMTTAAVHMEQMSSADLRRDVMLRELFIAVLGHDLRNPIHAIQLAVGIVLKRLDVPEAVMRIVQRIAASNDRAKEMVEYLLDLTRVRAQGGLPIEREQVDLCAICEQSIEELELSRPERRIHFEAHGNGHGEWDPGRMGQLLSNLVGNALDHSPPEEPVRVTLRGKKRDVVLEVANHGAPIPAELLPVLFDPFRRGEQNQEELRRSKGLGLGLFIVKAIVDAHGGTIEVTSTQGEGTMFRVTLPRAQRG